MKCFQFNRLVFGVKTSPFLLNAVINHLIENATDEYQVIKSKIKESFYIDDLVLSVEDENELYNITEKTTKLLKEANFELKEWEYTNKMCFNENNSVLGIKWDCDDNLFSDIKINYNTVVTKKTILSVVNSVFDPIGMLSPTLVIPKLLLQKCWESKLSWDEPVHKEIESKFLSWVKEAEILKQIKIPRWLFLERNQPYTLHIFCDASGSCYGAVIFVRTEYGIVQFVRAKNRLAPIKNKLTIPRLELMACVVGVRLYEEVIKTLQPSKTYFWSDSSVALHWIKADNEQSDIFVKNRVKEIVLKSEVKDWKHVSGEYNTSADMLSRGCNPSKFISSLWHAGPDWLKLTEETWPLSVIQFNDRLMEEKRVEEQPEKSKIINIVNTDAEAILESLLTKFSSYIKTIRVVAYIYRWLNSAKNNMVKGELTVEEMDFAENKIWKFIQTKELTEETKAKLSGLLIVEDENGLLRIKSKLILTEENENFKKPLILPAKHHIVNLLIKHIHEKCGHFGIQTTLARIRENYWIISGRNAIKRVLKQCVICIKQKGKPYNTPPAPLPRERLEQVACFQICGVDMAGPIHLKEGIKCWIALFTCGVYRAVHLEAVTSLTAEGFMQAFRRFVSRRTRPSIMYSDNGGNFTLTRKQLESVNWSKVKTELSLEKIKWKLIPPNAPWYGGWWERLVGVVKSVLKKMLGQAYLTYEEFITILSDCEAFINNRPLTYVSEKDELRALTPYMFLSEIPCNEVPELDFLDNINFKKRIRYVHEVRKGLKEKFRSEYIAELVKYKKTKKISVIPREGEVVLIGSDGVKRQNWILGKIENIRLGRDKEPRVAVVKTKWGC